MPGLADDDASEVAGSGHHALTYARLARFYFCRMGHRVPRPAPRRCHRRPRHLQRPHPGTGTQSYRLRTRKNSARRSKS